MINKMKINIGVINQQKGLALLTIMIFLVVLTIIGLSSMRTSRLEQMMSGNTQWSNIAFQAAESALVEAYDNEAWSAEENPSTVPSGTFDGGETSYDYSRYFIDFADGTKRTSNKAWSAKNARRANFKSAAKGVSKEQSSGAILATVLLEEGIYLIVPKP